MMDAVLRLRLRLRRHGRGRAAERGRGAWTRLHACADREIIGEICFGYCRDLVTGRQAPSHTPTAMHARRSKVPSGTAPV